MKVGMTAAAVTAVTSEDAGVRCIRAETITGDEEERAQQQQAPLMIELQIADEHLHANGVFSNVYRARLLQPEQRDIAIKKTWPHPERPNADLQMLRRLRHPNIVALLYHFDVNFGEEAQKTCECLVFEFLPIDMHKLLKDLHPRRLDLLDVKMYCWQMFRALDCLRHRQIAHRDVKPANLLVDPVSGLLKLGDFGSAKHIVPGMKSTSYQVTRYYRAPELLFGSVLYTSDIDVWAGTCVVGELLIGREMLKGRDKDDQTRLIIETLGMPSEAECAAMKVRRPRFAQRPARGLRHLFPPNSSEEGISLVEQQLVYTPSDRRLGASLRQHRFFAELRSAVAGHVRRSNGMLLPKLIASDFPDDDLMTTQSGSEMITNSHPL